MILFLFIYKLYFIGYFFMVTIRSFFNESVSQFKNNVYALVHGIGNYCGKIITWIKSTFGVSKKVDSISKNVFNQPIISPSPLHSSKGIENNMAKGIPLVKEAAFESALKNTSKFSGYRITLPEGHPCEGIVLTGVNIRPSNLFFSELFKGTDITTTMPGSGQLFAFNAPHDKIRECIKQKSDNGDMVEFSAKGTSGMAKTRKVIDGEVVGVKVGIADLSDVFGDNTYKISIKEIQNTLDSQKIYTSSLLPLPFYKELKKAMLKDDIVILPGSDSYPRLLTEMEDYKEVMEFLQEVKKDPKKFGFSSSEDFEELCQMTLYQIGSMVVKSEDYRIFMDGDGKILAREPGKNDAIRLINSCGIRGLHSPKTPEEFNQKIMTENFKTDLIAAESGIAIFPAVGMGVWGGDPDLYWRAFLDAIISQKSSLELVCVNPGHQKTQYGKYEGCAGEEFQMILDKYKAHYANNPEVINRLNKIYNLHESKKDIVQLAHQLKLAYPEKIISLFNASDPDVSLGYHVGEYTNNWPHTITTEENYTAMGTNGLCFEGITNVHAFSERLLQA